MRNLRSVRIARRIGYPVVVKPLDGNHGRGVAINLTSEAEVRAAFEAFGLTVRQRTSEGEWIALAATRPG